MKSTAPVGQTCPDIDQAIQVITSCVSLLRGIECDDKDVIHDIECVAGDLDGLLPTRSRRTGFFEEMRTANGALRDWGHEQQRIIEQLEAENEKLLGEIERLERRWENRNDTIDYNKSNAA